VLVQGGAGSGKTTTALWAGREHLLREGTCAAERVLFVTFSRTAVGQIARRAGPVFAGLDGRLEVRTFHALAYRLLLGFGRYAGHGCGRPQIESESRKKLLGASGELLSYDDLIPAALRILESSRIRGLVTRRWGLIICDEFQDTSANQWQLLQVLGQNARLLLLADPHQMIYTFIPTVSAQRLDEAREAAERTVVLEEASHRDPSGVIPAMARAIRTRRFDDPAIEHALQLGRLRVAICSGDSVPDLLVQEIRTARSDGCRTLGVFETTNAGAAQLGAELTERGIDHTLIGLPEAHGEALLSLATLVSYGLGAAGYDSVRLQLAVFLTAATRSTYAPPLAEQLLHDRIESADLRRRVAELAAALFAAEDTEALLDVAVSTWEGLGMTSGRAVWRRTVPTFAALARRLLARDLPPDELARELLAATERLYTEALISEEPLRVPVQVMNCHQTKGREADGIILVYREGGWVTSRDDQEPFSEASRVLYVALTRARRRVTVLLPPDPHPLVAPLARLA